MTPPPDPAPPADPGPPAGALAPAAPPPAFDPVVPGPQPHNAGLDPLYAFLAPRRRRDAGRRGRAAPPGVVAEILSLRVRVRNLEALLAARAGDAGGLGRPGD